MRSPVRYVVLACGALLVMGAGVDPVAPVALYLAIILIAAKMAGDLAVRIGQPAVLGELAVGVLLGNLAIFGVDVLEPMKTSQFIDILARLGVLILLFEVGLESTVPQMMQVGGPALVVATLGVITPFALGWLVSIWLLPDASEYVHAYIGATLTATSVGITARVLQDLGHSKSREARIILGAAVIDDVMGLIVLAVVTGIISAANTGANMGLGIVGVITLKAVAFLAVAVVLGQWLMPRLFRGALRLKAAGVLLATGLAFCFTLAWAAAAMGLAPIVGAFAAGLILDPKQYSAFQERGEHKLEELVHPIGVFLVPIFFVLMGLHTDLRAFAQPGVPLLAAAITVVAVIGKQACALGVWDKVTNRLAIGVGMIPRGEVGLIFANIGLGLVVAGERVVSPAVYSSIIVMVIVTTLITPPLLKWSLGRSGGGRKTQTAIEVPPALLR